MPPPPNTTPATALDLGAVPVDYTQDTSALGTGHVWYRYTAPASRAPAVVGVDIVSTDGARGHPFVSVWLDTAYTQYLGFFQVSVRFQLPVTAGTTYYVEVDPDDVNPAVRVVLAAGPNLATPAGSLAINDDTAGYPLAVLSAADGSVQQFRAPFPAGEGGAALPTGRSLWEDGFAAADHTFVLYDETLTRLATLVWPANTATPGFAVIATNHTSRFYVGDTGGGLAPARVTTIAETGVFGATTWTLPAAGLLAIGLSLDETILYYTGNSSDPSAAVLRWDLLHDVALAPFAAAVAGYQTLPGGLVVLADGTVLVGFYKSTTPLDSVLRRYAPDGAVVQTYPLGNVQYNKHAAALDDPLSVWVWVFPAGSANAGLSRFTRRRVSDGVALVSFDVPRYDSGVYQGAGAPTQPYGHSMSCPFIVLPYALPPFTGMGDGGDGGDGGGGDGGDGGGGDGTSGGWGTFPPIPPGRIRRVRRAPHLSAEQVEQFFARFQLDLEAGVGNAADPGADPQVFLRWSDDGGHTWRAPLAVSAGTVGAFRRRALWRRLGRSRDRVFEVSMSDPVKWALLAASLDAGKGTS